MLKNILKLEGVKRLKRENLLTVCGGGCVGMCNDRAEFLMGKGWSGEEAQDYMAACVTSCNAG
ncbi:hypothetical protein [Aquimarina macrocephali]|uniref:hypothetical protein n=1 Tax=Aquimarina macrocephali TaxID=666563 RepID=UPI000465E092|nr:hypothetical protein [Aquimarina macrocephali]